MAEIEDRGYMTQEMAVCISFSTDASYPVLFIVKANSQLGGV